MLEEVDHLFYNIFVVKFLNTLVYRQIAHS